MHENSKDTFVVIQEKNDGGMEAGGPVELMRFTLRSRSTGSH